MINYHGLVVIGISTGGPKLLADLLAELPPINAPMLIVQHIPKYFDITLAERLDTLSKMRVKLGCHGDSVEPGHVYLAPSLCHMTLQYNKKIALVDGPKVNSCCPSVDVTIKSLMRMPTGKMVGAVLTGMGSDGAEGLAYMKDIGAATIAQDERSSTIYGMPRAAYQTGKVDFVLPKEKLAQKIMELIGPLKLTR